MATRTLQPSEYDIQREVEALRDIRRRSTTPGALIIDPDLPNQSPPSSPTYRSSSGDPSIDGHSSETTSSSSSSSSSSRTAVDNPFSLFWVPASAHPEINHNAFRAFLKEHAKSPPPNEDEAIPVSASALAPAISSSVGLARRKSMLSRQYNPEDHGDDTSENEEIVSLKRNRSLANANRGPQLTINELQKLEELAEQAAESGDPTRFTNMLRRSLSIKMAAPEGTEEVMPIEDEADAPILVPPSGQPLRRAARTKIRKAGLPGDGGGHRFGASRRKGPRRADTFALDTRTSISSDRSSDDHGDFIESPGALRRQTISDDGIQRPESFSDEALIFEAYARDEDEDSSVPVVSVSPPPLNDEVVEEPPQVKSPVQPAILEALAPVIHQPQPSKPPSKAPAEKPPSPQPSPTPSDISTSTADHSPPPTLHPQHTLHPQPPFPATTPSPPSKKEKDKKGLFGKWGSDKNSKKASKEKDRDREARERAEKESGFFGSIFGGSKKKQDEQPPPLLSPGASSQAAQSILGSKNKTLAASGASLAAGAGVNFYSRYPIHVERAIYRLSHIKLANPRRPLYEQVLISNLMFWYLGVINKAQAQNASQNGQAPGTSPGQGQQNAPDQSEVDKAQREREQRERAERERQEKEQKEREEAMKKKESGKRGSLVKNTGGQGGRRAEIPVKGPSYEMQHRVMEQEYAGYNLQNQQGIQMNRSSSAPPGNNQYPRNMQNSQGGYVQPQQPGPGEFFYYSSDEAQNQQPQQGRLPPGAMPPDQPMRQHSAIVPGSSPGGSRGQQPLGTNRYNSSQENLTLGPNGNERVVSRSLSATALSSQTPPPTNGRTRKGQSAHAALPAQGRRPRSSEGRQQDANGAGEEDIPLAMWQQQRRR